MSEDGFTGPVTVIASYKPKEGRADELMAQLCRHGPVLSSRGLVTERPFLHLRAADGTVLEVFEWASEAASRSAHEDRDVMEVWKAIGDCAEFVPLSGIAEAARPFAHFTAVTLP